MLFCSHTSMKMYCGVLVLSMVSFSWVCATQFLKATYLPSNSTNMSTTVMRFSAPFLTCWFCMVWTILFFPLHLVSITICSCWNKKNNTAHVLQDALHKFRDAGITLGNHTKHIHKSLVNMSC